MTGCAPALLVAVIAGAPPSAPCGYEVTIIHGPPDVSGSPLPLSPLAINEQGDVAGTYAPGIYDRGFWWDGRNVFPLEQLPGFAETIPFDINDARQIAGDLRGPQAGQNRGFVFDDGAWTILEPPPGGRHSGAHAINEPGQVAGYRSQPALGQNHGFRWQGGAFTDIIPRSSSVTYSSDVNEIGLVAGYMSTAAGIRGFLWDPAQAIELAPLPGGDWSHAWAMNDAGQVAGNSRIPNPEGPGTVYRATMWSGGQVIDLGTLPGFGRSSANGINDAGAVVGWCDDYPSPGRTGFLWQDGVMTDLGDLVPAGLELSFENAADVNNAGQIVASARTRTFEYVGVLLTPIARPPGDVNADCGVDVIDLLVLLADWGAADSPADLDQDGTVGIQDLLILLAHWTAP